MNKGKNEVTEIFPYFKDLCYSDFLSFNSQLSEYREKMLKKDFSMLEDKGQKIDLNNITNINNGYFSTVINNVKFDCLFERKVEKRLYVNLNGAGESYPIFKRWSYGKLYDGSMLNIADPMLDKYRKLTLGWYYGNEKENYLEYVVILVLAIAKWLNLTNENIIFFGSSGGGYAALYCATKIVGSSVIAINPQIDLNLYSYAERFQVITKNDLKCKDKYDRNNLIDLICKNHDTKYILFENCRSEGDMVQLEKFVSNLGCNFKYGIQKLRNNIGLWLYDAECKPYHEAQDYPELFFCLRFLLTIFNDTSEYESLYLLISELVHAHHNLKAEIQRQKSGITELKTIYDFAEADHNVELVKKDFLDIQGTHKYDHAMLYNKLLSNRIYKLCFSHIDSKDDSSKMAVVVIKDIENNKLLLKKEIALKHAFSLSFKTGMNANKLELRIYPNKPEATEASSITVYNLILYEI